MQIGTQKNGEWWKCEMADCLCGVAIQVNLLHNNMADKTVWQINRGWINEYSLYYTVYVCIMPYVYACMYVYSILPFYPQLLRSSFDRIIQ